MAKYRIALNMEFCRHTDKGFGLGVKIAGEIGYKWVEPTIHTGWELFSEAHYYPSFSTEEDPLLMKEICDGAGVRIASISGHSPLMKPEAAVPRLTQAIIFADATGAKIVNTDEMFKPGWMDDEFAHQVMRYSLEKANLVAKRHRIHVCIEPHGYYTKTAAGLMRIVELVPSPWFGINWDTGNAYIAGVEDPYDGLSQVAGYVRHVHAKDIPLEYAGDERGMVTGVPSGGAIGEGVVDWEKVLSILEPVDREIFLSVECENDDQAERSLTYLTKLLGNRLIND